MALAIDKNLVGSRHVCGGIRDNGGIRDEIRRIRVPGRHNRMRTMAGGPVRLAEKRQPKGWDAADLMSIGSRSSSHSWAPPLFQGAKRDISHTYCKARGDVPATSFIIA